MPMLTPADPRQPSYVVSDDQISKVYHNLESRQTWQGAILSRLDSANSQTSLALGKHTEIRLRIYVRYNSDLRTISIACF